MPSAGIIGGRTIGEDDVRWKRREVYAIGTVRKLKLRGASRTSGLVEGYKVWSHSDRADLELPVVADSPMIGTKGMRGAVPDRGTPDRKRGGVKGRSGAAAEVSLDSRQTSTRTGDERESGLEIPCGLLCLKLMG